MTTKRNLFGRLVPCRCLRGEEEAVTVLDYSHCSLEQVPKEIFPFDKTLEELYLDANQIEELPKQLFNCQSLHKLSLPDNDLTVLPASIANLVNLRELDVSKNGIQEFPENIKNCKVLSVVEASVNPISKLPDGFTQLLNLTQLYLNDAFLDFLPANFGRLTKLQILELRENQLKMLPKTMSRLTQLERLDLGSNEFTEVPEVLEQLTALKEFWMDGNRLAILPGFIGKLKQLTYLDVSKNNVEMIDDAISGCENLQDLLLSSNVLQQLPETIGSLKKLTALKVDENQLLSLPDSVGGLSCLEEFDCSFNEIEALPPTIGQLQNQRTFAADHNFITELPSEIGNWKNVTVLFLHSNKLEYLPEEMGEMQKLKVINLSDNRLKNLPFSFTKLQELTAMWLSENQSKPLIPLQKEVDPDTQKQVLTNYMFPQQPRTEDVLFISDNESFNPSLWEEQRKQRAQVAFECDEDKDEREAPPREGNLKRYPTPYPDELKNMVKTAQSVVHRLKDDGTSDDSGTEMKQNDDRSVTTKNSGVEVTECTIESNTSTENIESNTVENCTNENIKQGLNDNVETIQTNAVDDDAEDTSIAANDDDVLEDTENTSSDEEMKMAELRPPLIDTPITQPKVVALCKEKRDDADSLFEEIIPNSNQNNSNCSSPSRISDTVSFNTESSQETLHSTPDKTAIPLLKRKNRGGLHETSPLLQNGTRSNTQFHNTVKTHENIDSPTENKEVSKLPEFELNVEQKIALLQREMDLNSNMQQYQKLLKIGVNKNEITADDVVQTLDEVTKCKSTVDGGINTHEHSSGNIVKGNPKEIADHLKNGNEVPNVLPQNQVNGRPEEIRQPEFCTEAEQQSSPLFSDADAAISGSAEELSPQREYPQGPVVKSHSITHIDTGGLKLYDINDNGPHEQGLMVRTPPVAGQGQNIIRSKSASLLSDQSLQPFSGNSSSSSDLLSCKKAVYTFDQNFNPQGISLKRGPVAVAQMPPVPQYNVQYSSSGITKENMWPQRPAFQIEQGNLGSHHHQRSETLDNANYVKHSANMNFSNRNNAQSNMSYNMQPRIGARQVEVWGCPPSERLIQASQRSTLQRQSSVSSASSVTLPETHHCRRVPVPEGDYMTYRDLHTLGRGPQIIQGSQRPLSARTYSVDGPTASRPHSARPHVTDVPERTMSISDFNYSRTSPTKRPNVRVKSEHSLLDAQGTNKVPPDWREQVLRHIEAKKLEKSMLSRSFNFNYAAFGSMHSGSCRELHDSQGNIALSVAERRNSGVHMFRYPSQGNSIGDPSQDDVFGQQNYSTSTHVMKDIPPDSMRKVPLTNGQTYQSSRVPINCNQPHHTMSQATIGRHPSREQLIDYLMLKVSHQPPHCPTQSASANHLMRQGRDIIQQEMHIRIDKNPELGFSISGGIGGRGNPFRPDDNGIFVTRVQPEGPASKLLQPGDKIVQANGYNFVKIEHGQAVSLLKTFQNAVDLIILREVAS
ncbi:erbin isoform X2 [Hemiscyllium ocellatum]|nr:erbin isoform X2 [Hemiscyllium ocellatum]XP_060691467.1 erbin isoform X2 [Hemiscyllium ocellatum]XP_060691476.1 erbin isoform X2 [Hemiscyllium ocellatum]XP_060691484.1 erbin isoform X2 [Hemiscyllium ocellatum]XP_060691493.1 erbin isoform X2 [Hemiscyllium ocellatum]XP_060691513.1 erbin isoform X2 [Hemiscyllium ocellatum]